jgi:UDP-N-acetylmuramoyl-tripeptide--D-alanyl-D-alanine ligase
MAVRFSDDQILQATGAERLQHGPRSSYGAVCTDTRQLSQGCLFVALVGERFDAHQFLADAVKNGAVGLVVQKGKIPGPLPEGCAVFLVENTLTALGALGRFHRERFKIPVGAVTGSNGKTTTKELVASILEMRGPSLRTAGNLNNEVGVPLTLFGLEPRHVAAIIEMGMNHKGEIARLAQIAKPDAGLITVVQPAHLEGLGSIEGVAEAKGELFHNLPPHGIAVVNADDPLIVQQAVSSKAKTLTFGRADSSDVRLTAVEPNGKSGLSITVRENGRDWPIALRLIGEHNAMNATGAFALALALGYKPEECVRGLEAAQGYARRLQIYDAPNGVTVVDDCYNANPASMYAALDALTVLAAEGRAVAVLGDMLELGKDELREHVELGRRASDAAQLLAFFGPRSKGGHEVAAKKLGKGSAHFEEIAPLIEWLKPQLKDGDVVLVKGSRGMKLERAVDALVGHATGAGH